jgi:hypothetical protein
MSMRDRRRRMPDFRKKTLARDDNETARLLTIPDHAKSFMLTVSFSKQTM